MSLLFFKQKTAYEVRISDWSSDVCSSDLALHPTETPLRYAQISFVGPVGGDCTVETRVLRQSKSSLFIDAGVSSDQGFGTAAVFAFSGDRASHLDHNRLVMPDAPDPDTLAPVPEHHARPSFTRHFDMRSEEHTSELQSLMRISYAVFCL